MVFKGLRIPLHTVGEQKWKIEVLTVNTWVLPRSGVAAWWPQLWWMWQEGQQPESVFNPYAEPVTIHGDVVMAGMEETCMKKVLMNEESPLGQYNHQPARRVLLERELPKGGPEYSMGQMGCVEEVPVPPHLQTLFEKATAKQSKAEQRVISLLLHSFHDVFSRDEFDLGSSPCKAAPMVYPLGLCQ